MTFSACLGSSSSGVRHTTIDCKVFDDTRGYNGSGGRRTMIGSRRVAVNDGVVIVDVVHGDGFWSRLWIRFMCLRRRLRQLQKIRKRRYKSYLLMKILYTNSLTRTLKKEHTIERRNLRQRVENNNSFLVERILMLCAYTLYWRV
jgi:hypothetical protein